MTGSLCRGLRLSRTRQGGNAAAVWRPRPPGAAYLSVYFTSRYCLRPLPGWVTVRKYTPFWPIRLTSSCREVWAEVCASTISPRALRMMYSAGRSKVACGRGLLFTRWPYLRVRLFCKGLAAISIITGHSGQSPPLLVTVTCSHLAPPLPQALVLRTCT